MPPNEPDPLASLRSELGEEDEPLFPAQAQAPAPKPATGTAQQHVPSMATPSAGKPAAAPPSLPPPLPKGRTGNFAAAPAPSSKTGPTGIAVQPTNKTGPTGIPVQNVPSGKTGNTGIPVSNRTSVVPPNASPAIAQLQGLQAAPQFAIPPLPPMVQRPQSNDPFQEPPEPRIPVGVDSEEKLKVFRGIMKGKDEARPAGPAAARSPAQRWIVCRCGNSCQLSLPRSVAK